MAARLDLSRRLIPGSEPRLAPVGNGRVRLNDTGTARADESNRVVWRTRGSREGNEQFNRSVFDCAMADEHKGPKRQPPTTPDGRYILVHGRLWRRSNPALSEEQRKDLVDQLICARRKVAKALRTDDLAAQRAAHEAVDRVKDLLGERGPVWRTDAAPN